MARYSGNMENFVLLYGPEGDLSEIFGVADNPCTKSHLTPASTIPSGAPWDVQILIVYET